MQRAIYARPDMQVQAQDGTMIECVSREALMSAMVDAAVILHHAGGHLAVSLARRPTGVPNEYVTTAAMALWKDHTQAKAQPEPTQPLPEPELEPVTVGNGHLEDEVDLTDVPEHLRGL